MRNIVRVVCVAAAFLPAACQPANEPPREKTSASPAVNSAATSQPLVSPWSAPSDEGLQTRLKIITRPVAAGSPIFVQMDVRHKDGEGWARATTAASYPADVFVRDEKGKQVGRNSVYLRFSTMTPPGEGLSVGVFLVGRGMTIDLSPLRAGVYSLSIRPWTTPEMRSKGMVQLPTAGPLRLEVPPAADSAATDQPLAPDYAQAENIAAYLKSRGGGYSDKLIAQGKSIVPGLVALVDKGDGVVNKGSHLKLWQYAAFMLGRIGDKRAVPFLVARLKDRGAMNFYVVSALGQLKVRPAVPYLVHELQTMDNRGWETMTSAYRTRATYLLKALEDITGRNFPKNKYGDPASREETLKAVNAWWSTEGKKHYGEKP